jgi:hypothetical protein
MSPVLLDDDSSYVDDLCAGAERAAEVFSFQPCLVLVVGFDQQPHLLAAVTDAHVMPLCIEQAGHFIQGLADCRRAAVFVHRLTYPQGLSVQRFSDSGGQVAWLEGGYYQQELFERHSEMAKSALAKEKRVQVEDLVADSHGEARNRFRNRKFPQFRAVEFLTGDPETFCRD